MKLVQLTPGAGNMYCGNCFRDNALVATLRRMGHDALILPLYLPMTLDSPQETGAAPIFFGGITVYLDQHVPLLRHAPGFLRRLLDHPRILKWAAGRAARTRAADVGDLTVSMLQGEAGNQTRQLDELVDWLRLSQRPDSIWLSNAMLIGMARRLRAETGASILCMFQGEAPFLNDLPEPHRSRAWNTLRERVKDADILVAPSHNYAALIRDRLGPGTPPIHVVPNGIEPSEFRTGVRAPLQRREVVIGYFARMCPEKGLQHLIDAYLLLKRRPGMDHVRLAVGGGCGPGDQAFVDGQKARLQDAGLAETATFAPNLDREAKRRFLADLDVFSVPALYGEAFGLYLLEAWASSVPVVQPRHAAFTELIEKTGAGILFEPGNPLSHTDALATLVDNAALRTTLGNAGRAAVEGPFHLQTIAARLVELAAATPPR